MVRIAREEVRTQFGVDLARLHDCVRDLGCGMVRPQGVLWFSARESTDCRLDWFLVEILRASGDPKLLFLELPLEGGGVGPEAAGLLPSRNWLLWQMQGRERVMLIYRPCGPEPSPPDVDHGTERADTTVSNRVE